MKKQMLATAIAGLFTVPAFAQVSVSGNLDVSLQRSSKVTETATSATTPWSDVKNSNTGGASGSAGTTTASWATSQLVFEATEDLGGGLKATARISQSINAETFGARDRYVDVAGGFGSVRLGRFTPFIGTLEAFGATGTTNMPGTLEQFSAGGAQHFGTAISGGDFTRQAGMVQYSSPSFNGFNIIAGYANNSSENQTGTDRLTETKMQQFGLRYAAGPLTVAVATGERKAKTAGVAATKGRAFFFNATANATVEQTTGTNSTVGNVASSSDYATGTLISGFIFPTANGGTVLGQVVTAGATVRGTVDATHDFDWAAGSYNLGPATVLATHARRKTTSNTTVVGSAQGTLNDAKVSSIGLMVPLGATTLRFGTYSGTDERTTATTDDAKLEGYQVSATYNLSKRTFLYAVMGENEVKRDGSSSTQATRVEKSNSLGIVHTF